MLKLLLVEDNESDAELIEYHIRKDGIKFDRTRVDSRASFQAAVDREKWDVILTDFSLPCFNAWDVLSIARTHDADIPVILVTGTKPEAFGPDFMRKGAIDYLLKSNLIRLGSAIRGALTRSHLARELRKFRLRFEALTYHVKLLEQTGSPGISHEKQQPNATTPIHQEGSPGNAVVLGEILSPRESKVITLMSLGKSLKEIAADLEVSPKTISTYRKRILNKLRLKSNADLIRIALRCVRFAIVSQFIFL